MAAWQNGPPLYELRSHSCASFVKSRPSAYGSVVIGRVISMVIVRGVFGSQFGTGMVNSNEFCDPFGVIVGCGSAGTAEKQTGVEGQGGTGPFARPATLTTGCGRKSSTVKASA